MVYSNEELVPSNLGMHILKALTQPAYKSQEGYDKNKKKYNVDFNISTSLVLHQIQLSKVIEQIEFPCPGNSCRSVTKCKYTVTPL